MSTRILMAGDVGSFGEETLVRGVAEVLGGSWSSIEVIAPSSNAHRIGIRRISGLYPDYRVTHVSTGRRGIIGRRLLRLRPARVLLLGADSVDGLFSDVRADWLGDVAKEISGRRGWSVLNVSVRNSLSTESASRLNEWSRAAAFYCRDARSADSLKARGVSVSGILPDAGFMWSWCPPRQGRSPRLHTVIVASRHALEHGAYSSVEAHTSLIVRAIKRVEDRLGDCKISISVTWHDSRADLADVWLAERYAALLDDAFDDVRVISAGGAVDIRRLLASADLCVSGRLHAAVNSLAVGTPVVAFDYADKVAGALSWLDSDFWRCVTGVVSPEALAEDMLALLEVENSRIFTSLDHLREAYQESWFRAAHPC